MIVSYSTMACPEWPLPRVFEAAAAYEFDAVEFRGLNGTLEVIELDEFGKDSKITRKMANDYHIIIQALWTSIFLAQVTTAEQRQSVLETIERYCVAAEAVGARQIRVFGGESENRSPHAAMDEIVDLLQEIGEIANKYSIDVMFETHDVWVNTQLVRQLISRTNCPNIGVAWDVWATSVDGKETPKESIDNLLPKIISVQIKDSIGRNFVLPGRGDVPLVQAVELLRANDYTGPITLEWEKLWHPELPEPEIALPAYRNFLKTIEI